MRRLVPYAFVVTSVLVISAFLPAPERDSQPDAAAIARTTGIRVLGATRGYATTALWLRASDAYRRGDHYEVLAAYQLIAELQPRNPAVYSYLSWNQAFNISAEFPERERREEWVLRGLNTLHEAQDRIPNEATLRQDEWHFILNRTITYPGAVLNLERARFGSDNPVWAGAVDAALDLRARLSAEDRRNLELFLEEVGLQLDLFDIADEFFALPEADRDRLLNPAFDNLPASEQGELAETFSEFTRFQMRMLAALSPDVHAYMALCHWCRLHAMVLAVTPALTMQPHGLDVERAVLNACRLAFPRIPPLLDRPTRQEIETQYVQTVAQAFLSGIENALRIGGRERAAEFIEDMQFNFAGTPELLPKDVIDRALQEISG